MRKKISALFTQITRAIVPSQDAILFANFLRRTQVKPVRFSRKQTLVALSGIPSHHVGLSQASPIFAQQTQSKLVGFRTGLSQQQGFGLFVSKLLDQISILNKGNNTAIYRAFGVRKVVAPRLSQNIRIQVSRDLEVLRSSVTSLDQLEKAEIRGSLIGDLIYDQHLLESKKVTPSLDDPNLWLAAERALGLLSFYEQYFNQNEIAGIFGINAYLNAIPNRVALSRGIPVFEVGLNIMRVGLPHEPRYSAQFPEEFRMIRRESLGKELQVARKYLDDFVSGLPVQPLFGHTFGSFEKLRPAPNKGKEAPKPTVLVAPHNAFTDSPHALGFCLFPDYGLWLNFLADLAEMTDFRWLIKAHPDKRDPEVYEANREWVREFAETHPQFEYITDDTPHGELIARGIDVVLTVSGSIAFEYAACGIPVINACPSNPHAGYNFTLSPETLEDYEALVRRIPTEGLRINRQEVIEFFFMRMFESRKNPFIDDLHEVSRALGGVFSFESERIYDVFIAQSSSEKIAKAARGISAFFNSNDLWWYERHADTSRD